MTNNIINIAKFDEVFVKSDSRKVMLRDRPLAWVSHPTSMTSRGYYELLDLAGNSTEAMAHYGVFMQLVKLSSQAKPYGCLQHSDGSAFSLGYIARTVGVDLELVRTAIDRLAKIRWLVVHPASVPQPSRQHPAAIPPVAGLHDSTVHDSTVRSLSDESDEMDWPSAFDKFWNAFDKKTKRRTAEVAFQKHVKLRAKSATISTSDAAKRITDAASKYAKTFADPNDTYKAHPTSWLNREQYDDDPSTWNRGRKTDQQTPDDDDWPEVQRIVKRTYNPDLRNSNELKGTLTPEQFAAVKTVGFLRVADSGKWDKQTPLDYRKARKGLIS